MWCWGGKGNDNEELYSIVAILPFTFAKLNNGHRSLSNYTNIILILHYLILSPPFNIPHHTFQIGANESVVDPPLSPGR